MEKPEDLYDDEPEDYEEPEDQKKASVDDTELKATHSLFDRFERIDQDDIDEDVICYYIG